MNAERFMCWVFGIGFWMAIALVNYAIIQRDEARQLKTHLSGSELICRVVTP